METKSLLEASLRGAAQSQRLQQRRGNPDSEVRTNEINFSGFRFLTSGFCIWIASSFAKASEDRSLRDASLAMMPLSISPPMSSVRYYIGKLIIIVASLIALTSSAFAQVGTNEYTVSNIAINATAENASAARTAAMLNGQKTALAAVYRRLSSPSTKLPKVPDEDLSNLISSFEIIDEKVSVNSYSASVTFHFSREELAKLLTSSEPANGQGIIKTYLQAETAAELSRIERGLSSVHLISKIEPLEINGKQTTYRLYFRGGVYQLSSAVAAKGLILSLDNVEDGALPTAHLYVRKNKV